VSDNADWIELDTEGATGNGAVTVSALANLTFDARAATVTFAAGGLTRLVTVEQEAGVPTVLTPDNGADIILSNELSGNITFSWLADATSYNLIVAKNADLTTDVVFTQTVSDGTSFVLTEADIQTLLESTSGLKRYKKNELHWGVKTSEGTLIGEVRTLSLSGRRVFVDTRGAETITYEVAVVDNQYYQGIWMAQNLKTKLFLDGSSAEYSPYEAKEKRIFEAPSTSEFAYDLTGIIAVAPVDNPRNGYYYHPDWWLSNNNDWTTMVPTGWKMPTVADWTELKNALSSYGNIAPVLDPEMSTWDDDTWNTWGLYLSFAGVWGGEYPRAYSQQDYLTYITVPGDGWSIRMFTSLDMQQGYDIAAIRLKYVGDDE
jgi:uncharacterized protein (TIGR02145 family)